MLYGLCVGEVDGLTEGIFGTQTQMLADDAHGTMDDDKVASMDDRRRQSNIAAWYMSW